MSKFTRLLKENWGKFLDTTRQCRVAPHIQNTTEYKIFANFSLSFFAESGNPEDIDIRAKHAKKRIVESVFGEFREKILEIKSALFDNKINLAIKLLNELETDMFEI